MERIPEPEIMSTQEEAKVYDLADFSEVNQAFANRVVELAPSPGGILIDLGCGPGDILLRIFKMAPTFFLVGFDGSEPMLKLAAAKFRDEWLEGRILLIQGDAKNLTFSPHTFEVVISNSLVHHLPDPFPFWEELKRVTKPNGTVLVQDLSRPATTEAAWEIVERNSGKEPQLLKDLFFYSLRASFTVEEVSGQLGRAGLQELSVKMSSDRHWEVSGRVKR